MTSFILLALKMLFIADEQLNWILIPKSSLARCPGKLLELVRMHEYFTAKNDHYFPWMRYLSIGGRISCETYIVLSWLIIIQHLRNQHLTPSHVQPAKLILNNEKDNFIFGVTFKRLLMQATKANMRYV